MVTGTKGGDAAALRKRKVTVSFDRKFETEKKNLDSSIMTEAGVAFLPLFDSCNNTEPVG